MNNHCHEFFTSGGSTRIAMLRCAKATIPFALSMQCQGKKTIFYLFSLHNYITLITKVKQMPI